MGIIKDSYPDEAVALGKDGLRFRYNATMWKDIVMDISGRRLNGTTGKVDYDWDNNAIKFQADGLWENRVDRVQGNQEINHEMLLGDGTIFKPHIHWFQKVEGIETVVDEEWLAQASGSYTDVEVEGDIIKCTFTLQNSDKSVTYTEGVDYSIDGNSVYNLDGGSLEEGTTYVLNYKWDNNAQLDETDFLLEMRWRIVKNAYGIDLTTPDWTTVQCRASLSDRVFDYDATKVCGKEYMGQISRFPDIVVDCNVSDTIQMQLVRTDSETGDMLVYFFDLHGEVDALGSEEELDKWNF